MVALSCMIATVVKSEGGTAGPDGGAEESLPLGPQSLPELIEFRRVDDAVTMKALADPLRIKIMRVLGKHAHDEPRVMTVKQLAEELGEPTTKLYRHMKQLLAVDLIQVAEVRLVGGIVEQHYRVAQKGWGVNPEGSGANRELLVSEELFGVADAAIEDYFSRYEEALRSGKTFIGSQQTLENPPYVRSVGAIVDYHIPQEKAAEFGERFHALVKEFTAQPDERVEGSVSANLLAIFYATEPED